MGQVLGNMFEMGNANRQHNLARLKGLAVLKPQKKAAGRAIYVGHKLVFQFGHHAIPEGKPVRAEGIKLHRNTGVRVLDAPLRAKLPQGESFLRIVNVGSEAIRLEHHALRHVVQPAVHGTAENAEWDAPLPEMRRNRESVRTRSNNHCLLHALETPMKG